jgi:hypothetical protein
MKISREDQLYSDLMWESYKAFARQVRLYIKLTSKLNKKRRKKIYKNNSIYKFLREKLKQNKKLQAQNKTKGTQNEGKKEN